MIRYYSKAKGLTKDSQRTEIDNGNVYNILSIDNTEKETSNVEDMVHSQLTQLERLSQQHNKNIERLASKLEYIRRNIGLETDSRLLNGDRENLSASRIVASELLEMPIDKVVKLTKSLLNIHVLDVNKRLDSELTVIVSHLIFRNELSADLFSRIIMKMSLANVRHLHEKLVTDPSGIIKGWSTDGGRSRLLCGLALAARYKMLKDYNSAKEIIRHELVDIWFNSAKCGSNGIRKNDMKNMVNICDGLVEYGFLVTNIIKTQNGDLIYAFWEKHDNDYIMREWLEKEILKDEDICRIDEYQKLIVKMYTNAAISTTVKWRHKVINISRKLQLGSIERNSIKKDKFCAFIELLLDEIEEEFQNDEERVEYVERLRKDYADFKIRVIGSGNDRFENEIKIVHSNIHTT